MTKSAGFLKVSGTEIVNADNEPVVLKGTATGGHLNMENFITGYPGHETEHKKALLKVMGQEKFDFFFDKFYEYFWTEKDAEFMASLGLNCLRIPFNYRHFLDDNDLTKINPKGFKLLDQIIDSCAKYGIYTILDLHAVPGGQNQDWHSDSGVHKALFWDFGYFQERILALWTEIAKYYKDNTWVAGYNPLNEPADVEGHRLTDFYTKAEKQIRAVDKNHILFLDGNTYSMEFNYFPDTPYPNTVYSIHDYSNFGFPGNTVYEGTAEQKAKLKRNYERKIVYMKKIGVPVWNGEFGPVYSSEVRGDKNIEKTNHARYNLLKDQLAIYKTGNPGGTGTAISWSIWVYKDIGYQGLTYVSPKSKWFQVLNPWFERKKSLGLDKWGRDADPEVEKGFEAIREHIKKCLGEKYDDKMYPWKSGIYVDRVLRDILMSDYLLDEFASYFKDLSFDDLEEMAASFKFENIETRDTLNKYLSEY